MRKIMRLLVALAMTIGLGVGLAAGGAEANVYSSLTSCNHTSSKWICFDVSAGTVTVKTGPGSEFGALASYTSSAPTRGWIAFDVYECNADGTNQTIINGPGANPYNLPPGGWTVTDSTGLPYPGKIVVSSAIKAQIAWYANSQSGFTCMVVP